MTLYYPPLTENASIDTNGVLLYDANGGRRKLFIQAAAANTEIVRVYLLVAGAASPTSESFFELDAGGLYEPSIDDTPSNAVFVKSASGTQTLRYTEV